MCDANYKFTLHDVGYNGRISDIAVLNRSALRDVLNKAVQHFPTNETIGNNRNLPYCVIGNRINIQQPYQKKTV